MTVRKGFPLRLLFERIDTCVPPQRLQGMEQTFTCRLIVIISSLRTIRPVPSSHSTDTTYAGFPPHTRWAEHSLSTFIMRSRMCDVAMPICTDYLPASDNSQSAASDSEDAIQSGVGPEVFNLSASCGGVVPVVTKILRAPILFANSISRM
jgi:hypothetical protein